MQRPIVCVGALIWGPGEHVLIVRTEKWQGLWGVPGGKVKWGETLAQAVLREAHEETGLMLRNIRQAQTQEAVISQEFHRPDHMLLVDFFAQADTLNVVPNEEIKEWLWLPLAQAGQLPLNSYTKTLIDLALAQESA